MSAELIDSVWKPLHGPVRDWPLALCDSNTLNRQDVISSDLVYPATVVENCLVRSNPQQKWYYISSQTADEAWVFVQSDSDDGGQLGEYIGCIFNQVAVVDSLTGVPHSSFCHPESSQTDKPRESIEVRAIAYFQA